MKCNFFKKLAAATCAALLFFPVATVLAAQRTVSGSVPPIIAKLGLVPLKSLPSSNILNLAISLPVRDQAGLDLFQQQVSDPASPNYRKYLTTTEFAERFGASKEDYQTVVNFAQNHGLTVTATHPNRLVLDVSGTVAAVQAAFQVQIKVYNDLAAARTFYAPTTEPVVSTTLPILSINGLDNYYLAQPKARIKPWTGSSNQLNRLTPNVGSAPDGISYMGSDFRKAYAPGVSLTGKGQSVGLLQFDGFYPADIAAYAALIGLNNPPKVVVVPVNGGVPVPGGGNGEVCLDIEMVMSMAPGVSTIYVYEAPNSISLFVSILSRMANDNLSRQLSCSWGGGPTNAAAEQIFQQMAVQGQSFFNACGDDDAYVVGVNPVTFPADSPNITQVGGTKLITGPNAAYKSEVVWNDNIPYRTGYLGTGGGISPNYPLPYWQQGISMVANHGSTTNRNVPDVALTAEDVWLISDNGQSGSSGGTSAAAPLWAGFTALINQQAALNANPSVGFVNPALYALAKTIAYTNYLHDTLVGSNAWPSSPTNFFAVPNYDLCTGLGTPNGSALIYKLAGKPIATGFIQLTVDPESGSTLLNSTAQTLFVTVNDGGYDVTNAIVTAIIPGVTNLTLRNDGQAPDAFPNDSVYSGTFQVPAAVSALTLTLTATATNIVGATNVIYYTAVTVLNDNFANATKVPAGGAAYVSNNRQATLQPGEPAHNGDTNDAASLWWSWTPLTATNVLIDTIGSKIDTLLAVYTGSGISNLVSVASTSGNVAQLQPAFLSFNALAGVTYRIAVASVNSNSVGSLALHVTPGGQLDTASPNVAVSSPLSGQTVTSRGIKISGVASDSSANASGVSLVTVSVNGVVTVATGTTNWTAAVALQPELNSVQVYAVDATGNYSTPANITVNYLLLTATNDFFVNAISLTNTSGVFTSGNTNATKEAGEPNIAGNPGGKSVWWSFTPPADGVLTLNTTNSTFDTLLGLYTGPDAANLTTIADNDDAYPAAPGGFSFLSVAVKAGQNYKISVDGYDAAFGRISLSYAFVPAPVYQVTSESAGGTVQLTVTNVLGGTTLLPGQAGNFAGGSVVTLFAVPASVGQFNNWSGSIASSNNPLTLVVQSNLNLTANFAAVAYTDGFESGNLSHLSWVTDGSAPWFVQTNVVAQGVYAARSGVITDSQSSSLILTTNFTAGTGSFDYKVSSEAGWDFLNFYVDGVLNQQWSGTIGWANYAFALTVGTHTLTWSYVKDPNLSSGLDAAFIDDVNLPISSTIPQPPQLQLQRQGNGSFLMTLTGQVGSQYVTQVSTNLVTWQNFSTNTANGGVIQITIPVSTTNQAQFYRAFAP
ncbi:MAG: protease pro-enzyme activation domain-containing protein [Limisphaerales bacterium]